jgi:hypothetical protein
MDAIKVGDVLRRLKLPTSLLGFVITSPINQLAVFDQILPNIRIGLFEIQLGTLV